MDIQKDWPQIKRIFYTGFKTSGYFTVASTGPDGSPHLTPIGSLILYGPDTESMPMNFRSVSQEISRIIPGCA